jgi:polyisoprenoid-binding protein YceI
MTATSDTDRTETPSTKSRRKIALGVVAVAIAAVAGLAWWLGYFTDTPEQASLEASVLAISGDTESGDTESATTGPTSGVAGTWTVAANDDVTFVGYRINEVLTTIGDFEVVGRTGDVTGTIEIDGLTIRSTELEVDMGTLTTDNSARDGAMREQALETDLFPTATFTLTEPVELAAEPVDGEPITLTATGDLTVHGVTQPVAIPLEAQIVNDVIVVVGQLPIALSDYDIAAPSAPIVASVEDSALLEISVALTRQ